MDDQRFAGKHLQRRRRIEIAARRLAVRRRAADHLIVEKEKVLDRRGYRIERGLALPRGEPDFEDTFLARQRYGLSELRSNCGIVLLSAVCAQAVAPGHASAARKATVPSIGTQNRRPSRGAWSNDNWCRERRIVNAGGPNMRDDSTDG